MNIQQIKELPWFTFRANIFLYDYLIKNTGDLDIFEYGSGGSTLYLSKFARKIFSVETNLDWYNTVNAYAVSRNIHNIQMIYMPANAMWDYVGSVSQYRETYDVIIIDGIASYRSACACLAKAYLSPKGILICDDWQRSAFSEARNYLRETLEELVFRDNDLNKETVIYRWKQ